ncbi:MAG: YciI family protein, partial [Acidimicrobiales bacterium]
GLHPASSATVVRSSAGVVSMSDGPYAGTKEQMGGCWMIEAVDLDAALAWAAKAAAACGGPVEVRPSQG